MTYSMMILVFSASLGGSPQAPTNMAANSVSNTGVPRSSGAVATPRSQAAAPEKTYCTSGTITGSRVVKQECKTKAQWAKDGVDIDELMNGNE